jgi:outer membrane protein TolC
LCVLLGRPPDDLSYEIGVTAVIPRPPENLAFGVPADLLRRRPDIRRVESELAAQSARIGIAKTDFYPQIRLNGNIGFAAEEFGQLFNSRSQVGIISPSFSWNLLNYRRIKNNVAAETAAFRAQCNAYQSAVLKAAKEAEDAQVAFLLGFDRADALHRAVQGASDAVEKSEALYQAGTIDFGRVYVLQAERLLQQDQLAIAEGNIALSLVQLFKALGGGWQQAAVTVAQFDQLQLPIVAREVAWPAQPTPSSDYSRPLRAVSASRPINRAFAN